MSRLHHSKGQGPAPQIHSLYVPSTHTWQYVVADPATRRAVIIDAVLDYPHDPSKGPLSTSAADSLLSLIYHKRYVIDRILETHARPANLSSAWYLRTQLREKSGYTPRVFLGKSFDFMQRFLARNGRAGVSNEDWAKDFDTHFTDGDIFTVGRLVIQVLSLPGQYAEHVGYRVGHDIFIGDPVFDPNGYRGMKDVPEASTPGIWSSLQRLLNLSEDDKIYVSGIPGDSSASRSNTPTPVKTGTFSALVKQSARSR